MNAKTLNFNSEPLSGPSEMTRKVSVKNMEKQGSNRKCLIIATTNKGRSMKFGMNLWHRPTQNNNQLLACCFAVQLSSMPKTDFGAHCRDHNRKLFSKTVSSRPMLFGMKVGHGQGQDMHQLVPCCSAQELSNKPPTSFC